jgi:hypothetical protein
LVDPVRRDAKGLSGPTPQQTRGRRWRRTSHGFFVPSDVTVTVDQRIVEAAAVLPSFGGVTGWAALRWLGAAWFDGLALDGRTLLPVVLATSEADVRPQSGIEISAERLGPDELTVHDALSITTALRSVIFAMRHAPGVRTAVVVADMAMYADLVSLEELWAWATVNRGWTGCPQLREALALADENAWSPRETLLRLVWMLDADLRRPRCNVPVFDLSGRHIGTPDLLDEEAGVVGEYDGSVHLAGRARATDVRREAAFRAVGLEYFPAVAGDWADRAGLVARMLATRSRARFADPRERLWTTKPPSWWIPTDTVAQRRALTAAQRARFLARRTA